MSSALAAGVVLAALRIACVSGLDAAQCESQDVWVDPLRETYTTCICYQRK